MSKVAATVLVLLACPLWSSCTLDLCGQPDAPWECTCGDAQEASGHIFAARDPRCGECLGDSPHAACVSLSQDRSQRADGLSGPNADAAATDAAATDAASEAAATDAATDAPQPPADAGMAEQQDAASDAATIHLCPGTDGCGECRTDLHDDCVGSTNGSFCVDTICRPCLESTHCTDPAKTHCDNTYSCVECINDDHCPDDDGGSGGPILAICHQGRCVECTQDGQAICGGTSCHAEQQRCTTTPLASRGACQPCAADSECLADMRCVPMEAGPFCLTREAAGCAPPFSVPITAQSLSGAPSEAYCGIDEAVVSCLAVLDHINGTTCAGPSNMPDTSQCTAQGNNDSTCKVIGGTPKCTYVCNDLLQCLPGEPCVDNTCG